ncbi:Major allergen Pru ar 1 [Hibiscus syriacus]|uniref:Major allergen Pru ar 1 n=1 Tax=Hibiscus syriacus TaxID=106335 RepID=A0A6A3BBA4_HIBSY|nr:Major allergen Pru ar 1 [Hibiscus syriacus]
MGVFTYKSVINSSIPPAKMFKACILDGDNLIPRIVPQAFKSVEYIQGNGEPGSIRKVTFAQGYLIFVIEGDPLMNKLDKITYEIKLEPSPDGGSICKTTSKYYTSGDIELKEEDIKEGKEKASGILFKAIEAYLLENPHAY